MIKQLGPLAAVGIAQELLWLSTYRLAPFRDDTPPFLAVIAGLFLLCLAAYFLIPIRSKPVLFGLLAFALLHRVTVLPAPPHESEDVYRYLWDARIAAAGIDPYRDPPQAPELESFRDERVYPPINSKELRSVYPPLSQLLFRLSHTLFGESIVALKAVFGILEFSALLLAWRLLVAFALPLQPLFLVAWNPFFVFEFWHSGHSDSGMMFFILLAVWLLRRGRDAWGMAAYACSVLVKLHPVLWFPLFLRRASLPATAAGLAIGALLTLLYFTPLGFFEYLGALAPYFRLFEFNSGIHYFLTYIGRAFFDQSWSQTTGPFLTLSLVAIAAVIWWRFPARDEKDLLHAGFWIMTADVCLSTSAHPWYLSWAALALPFFPYAFMVYWLGASMLSYLAYAYRPVFEPTWVLVVEYVPMYALMAWEAWRGKPLLGRQA